MVFPAIALAFSRVLGSVLGRGGAAASQTKVVSNLLRVMEKGFKRLPKNTGIPSPITPSLTVKEKELDRAFRKLVRVYISKLLDNLARDAARRHNTLMNMVVFGARGRTGSAINRSGTTGLVGTDLFRKVRDSYIIGELGFPTRYNAEAKLIKGLKQSIKIRVFRPKYNHFVMRFILDYNELRRLTPHPAAGTPTGRNIKIVSWLDWLSGDVGVTDAGFVRLSQIRGAKASKKPLSPRSSNRVGPQYTGWMLSKKESTFKQRTGSNKGVNKGGGKKSGKVRIPSSWKISKPVNRNWVTERSLSIGVGLVDLYAGGLIQRVHYQTIRNFTVIV